MTLRDDSYGSVNQVRALTRHLLDGESTFSNSTRPTLDDVEAIIDRVSGTLNAALAGQGFSVPLTNSTAVLACADWVVNQAARQVELTQRGTGWNEDEGSRLASFSTVGSAQKWAADMAKAFQNMGIGETAPAHRGLTFTGLSVQANRADPQNTNYEQPKFKRGQFDG